ncbi:MAG: DUF2480 family protein [Cyclobacteriaceae bacterium]|nr:DUF2480 family protein [Cyclobacteriaceae bacterium]
MEKEKVDAAGEVVNRVTTSALVILDLEEYHTTGERVQLDIKPWLFQELILKEKEFRDHIKSHNWTQYEGKLVTIICSAGAIIPTWAYMLVTIAVQPFAKFTSFGSISDLEIQLYSHALKKIDWQQFNNAKVVIKGCSKMHVPIATYVEATNYLRPIAASIMFGEPCSTVPLFKKKIV